jgi:hypothetical protein
MTCVTAFDPIFSLSAEAVEFIVFHRRSRISRHIGTDERSRQSNHDHAGHSNPEWIPRSRQLSSGDPVG